MANDITAAPNQSVTRWSPPVLPTSLATVLADDRMWRAFASDDAGLPAIADDDREAARAALAVYADAPKGSPTQHVSKLVGSAAAVMARRDKGSAESEMSLAIYQDALSDIDRDVLAQAFKDAIRTLKFFPTVAEIREIASRLPAPPRVVYAWRLRQLLRQHRTPPASPADLASPDDLADLRNRLDLSSLRLSAPPAAQPEPTIEDYLALGVSEADAKAALSERARILARQAPEPREPIAKAA